MLAEGKEQIEFRARRCHLHALWAVELAFSWKYAPSGETQGPYAVSGYNAAGVGAPQERPDAGYKFARIEWFRDIIVRPDFKSDDPIDILVKRRQHDDRNGR